MSEKRAPTGRQIPARGFIPWSTLTTTIIQAPTGLNFPKFVYLHKASPERAADPSQGIHPLVSMSPKFVQAPTGLNFPKFVYLHKASPERAADPSQGIHPLVSMSPKFVQAPTGRQKISSKTTRLAEYKQPGRFSGPFRFLPKSICI